jgi:hypothetical protein
MIMVPMSMAVPVTVVMMVMTLRVVVMVVMAAVPMMMVVVMRPMPMTISMIVGSVRKAWSGDHEQAEYGCSADAHSIRP